MHIHGNHLNLSITNPYVVAAAEKTAASERAAKVRKKLIQSAAQVDGFDRPDGDLVIGRWMDQRNNPTYGEDAYYPSQSAGEPGSR